MHNNFVIGIQCFVKLDTLRSVLEKLENCYGVEKYTLVLFGDSSNELLYKKRLDWIPKNIAVLEYIEGYSSNKFKSIVKHYSAKNLGPYEGCKKTVDLCLDYSDYIIFMEDDTVVAKDYLLFYESLFNQFILSDDNIFAGSASSVISHNTERPYHVQKVHWVNSTEFAITRQKWQEYGYIRSQICGDVKFGQAVKSNGKYTIMPRVRRMSKIGQGHPDSFSVLQKAVAESSEANIISLPTELIDIDVNNYKLIMS